MTMDISTTGLFCEDIRTEMTGQHTLVGVFQQVIHVQEFPGALQRLAVYLLIEFDTGDVPEGFKTYVLTPDGVQHKLMELPAEQVKLTAAAAKEGEADTYSFELKIVLMNFPITKEGNISLILEVDNQQYPCASLRVREAQ